MDSSTPSIDFAVIGHQDSWQHIAAFINGIRTHGQDALPDQEIKNIFSFIPPRDIFRMSVKSKTGAELKGVYIETFISPDQLGTSSVRTNISKVHKAISWAKKMEAKMVTLGGFTSIVLEGLLDSFSPEMTKFTTGNTLTAAFIVKGIEKAAQRLDINLQDSTILMVGATGDIGTACTHYFKKKVKKLLLCARNHQRLMTLSQNLITENVAVKYSIRLQDLTPEADVIICVASSSDIELKSCKNNVLICDAGYPKNLESGLENVSSFHLFHGGMGQVNHGFHFIPDYSTHLYQYAAPNISHGCILEAIVLAFENKFESYSQGKGNISTERIDEIYTLALKHGITMAPFYNTNGLWRN